MSATFFSSTDRLPPSRAVVLTHNRKGRAFGAASLERWLRYLRVSYTADQVDLFSDQPDDIDHLIDASKTLDMSPSLRTSVSSKIPDLVRLRAAGLVEVHLGATEGDALALLDWLKACHRAEFPVRLSLPVTWTPDASIPSFCEELHRRSVTRLDLSARDPFRRDRATSNVTRDTLNRAATWIKECEDREIELNVVGLPFCAVNSGCWENLATSKQQALDHSQYIWASAALADRLADRTPWMMDQAITVLLARRRLHIQPTDNLLLPWLIGKKYVHFAERAVRRISRNFNPLSTAANPKKSPTLTLENVEEELARSWKTATAPDSCTQCRMRRICDYAPLLDTIASGFERSPIEGSLLAEPMHFSRVQRKHYSQQDLRRLNAGRPSDNFVEEALDRVRSKPADRVITPDEYMVLNSHYDVMEGGIKWWSITNTEKLSSVLAELSPPFTLAFDVGGGIADFVGVALGRHARFLAPMTDFRHELIFHVNEAGESVLLRDGLPVRPAEFEGQHYVPLRIGDRVMPQIALWNIDESIATHNVRIWQPPPDRNLSPPDFSVVIVSTRFTRRLQAVLRNLAHQAEIDMNSIEVVVAYSPGIDATDDLLDSVERAYPQVRIIRAPFAERYHQSKGFLINEAIALSNADWIVLLDSDTLLPPNFFATLNTATATHQFIAPDGRKMLGPEVAAKILLGDIDPWDCWESLVSGPGEFRHRETKGVPVGFCQCVSRKWLEELPYIELEHFENADMWFALQLRDRIGPEFRLSGMPVLHLDHGGSQWYGTRRHL